LKVEVGLCFINLSSVAGIKVFAAGGSVYSGTKFAVHAISEDLRVETRNDNNIRVTILSPGAVDSELKEGSSDPAGSQNLKEFCKIAIPADSIARAIAYAIEPLSDVEIDEIVVSHCPGVLSPSQDSVGVICARRRRQRGLGLRFARKGAFQ